MRLKHRAVARSTNTTVNLLSDARRLLLWIREEAEPITTRANNDMNDGPRGISYEPRPHTPGPSNPTEQQATHPTPDPAGHAAMTLAQHLADAYRHARACHQSASLAERAARSLLPIPADAASQLAANDELKHDPDDPTRSTVCANPNCQRVVARTPNDRLRGGRCNPCRMYLTRTSSERPRHLCALDTDLLGTDALGLDPTRLITTEQTPTVPSSPTPQEQETP